MILSIAVLLGISFMLSLPAKTLTPDKAVEQGGIDVPQEELQEEEKGDPETVDSLAYEGEGYTVRIENAELDAQTALNVKEIQEDSDQAKVRKAYKRYYEQALKALRKEKGGETIASLSMARFYDITLDADGKEIQPERAVDVNIIYDKALSLADEQNLRVIHFREDTGSGEMTPEVLDRKDVELELNKKGKLKKAAFPAESFSVYAVVYTVDFHWDLEGKDLQYSILGGGFVSFRELVKNLGIVKDDKATDEDEVQQLLDQVAKIEFSKPKLVSVSQVEKDTNVGALKEALGLECEYSAELTKAQIAEIDARKVRAGDWAMISVRPFKSEETLTVTMKDGTQWDIRVKDEQIKAMHLSDSGKLYEVTVTYGEDAKIPEGSSLKITEFEKGSEEYNSARKAYLADCRERGEAVNLDTLGMAALDISILNKAGHEIEPSAPVQVDMKIKALPGVEDLGEVENTLAIQHHVETKDGVVVESVLDGKMEGSFRMDTDEKVVADGKVVDPESVKESDFPTPKPEKVEELDTKFEANAFSTFTISWNEAYGNGTKIHYVDENGNDLNVSNTTLPTTIGSDSASPAYLIYDIEGYEYDHTYRRYYYGGDYWNPAGWRTENILPELRRHDASYYFGENWNGWVYTDGSKDFLGNYNWEVLSASNAQNKDDIYVVYKKKPDITQGGKPTVKPSSSVTPPVAPRINKESTPNGDDTNTLALSIISDTAKLEVEKLADVIVVFDVSGSMSTKDMGGNTTRLQAAKNAVNDLATQLAEKKNSDGKPLVRMSLIQFSSKASSVVGMTDLNASGLNTIQSKVNGLSANGGTNWDHALQLANEENDLDPGRATFVIFVTDGDPTFRNARMNVTDQELQGETNDGAWNTYGLLSPNPFYLDDNVYGPADNDKTNKCYEAAVKQGQAIVSAGKNIYTIGISNDVKKVEQFNSEIHGNGSYIAANSGALQQAFSDIEASISGVAGWGNIKMTDGITSLTNTVQKTGLVNVGGDFTYWMAPAPANWENMTEAEKNAYKPSATDFVEWDPGAHGAGEATYNAETGAVEWNMGDSFVPEAGVTYQVRFKVWPSQEAYDYIAKLNNGTISYDNLPEEVRAQIIKNGTTYTLKTNKPDANMTYKSATKTGDTVTVSGEEKTLKFPAVEDLGLSADRMKVEKRWVNDLDPNARWKSPVTMRLTDGDGTLYKSIDLNEDNQYTAEDNFISCGLAKVENNELIIYEKGHDFKLSEPEGFSYYWDLDSQIYRPMIIDATLTMLVKAEAPTGMGDKTYYSDGGVNYYKIEGGIYKAISTGDTAASITATNIRRSNLNLQKKVVDEQGQPVSTSDPFTFTVRINSQKDENVWFSAQTDPNDTSTIVKELSTNATPEVKNGEKTGYYHAASGSDITFSIQPGWNLRFTNLPNGTTYTITESNMDNYTFQGATIDNNGTFAIDQGTTTGNGTIDESNKQYTVTYTNQAVTQQVYIHKTGQTGETPLQGAVFSLYTKAGYESSPKTPLKTGLVSDNGGQVDLGRLTIGDYYLVETSAPAGYILPSDPVTIKVQAGGVQYTQVENSMSSDKQGVSGNKEKGYTLVVTNTAGVELPHTGGPGTKPLTILGFFLVAGTGWGLWRRRRIT